MRQWTKISHRYLTVLGWLFMGLLTVSAEELKLQWDPPIYATNASSYILHVGTVSRTYTLTTNVGLVTEATLGGLSPGVRYYITATTLTKLGKESGFSNELIYDVPVPAVLPVPIGLTNQWMTVNTTSPAYPFQLQYFVPGTTAAWDILTSSSDATIVQPSGIFVAGTGADRTIQIVPVADRLGTVTITVDVTDYIQTNSIHFQLTITPPNRAPVVDAGAGATVRTNLNFLLRGRASDDGLPVNPGRLRLLWSKVSGPGTVTFGNTNLAVSSVRFSSPGLYRLRLTAFDGELSTSSDTVIRALLVSDTTPPSIGSLVLTEASDTTLTVRWETDEPTDGQLRFGVEGGTLLFSATEVTPTRQHTSVAFGLQPETTYELFVRARDASGNTSFSSRIHARTLRRSWVSIPVVPDPSPDFTDDTHRGFRFYTPTGGSFYTWVLVDTSGGLPAAFTGVLDQSITNLISPISGEWPSASSWIRCVGFGRGTTREGAGDTVILGQGEHLLGFEGTNAVQGIQAMLVTNDPLFVPSPGDSTCCTGQISDDAPVIRIPIEKGYSMFSVPLVTALHDVASMFPSVPEGTQVFKYDETNAGYLTNTFSGGEWTDPTMTLDVGEGGVLWNPGNLFNWRVEGAFNFDASPIRYSIHSGENFLSFQTASAGLLTQLMPELAFVEGDTVMRMNPAKGDYDLYTFTGGSWDTPPFVNLGESVYLNLVLRSP